MTGKPTQKGDFQDAVVRICPACGVVNPAKPGESCPHLQLARFDGLDDKMIALLSEVAEARRHFATRLDELKNKVKQAINNREVEVETSQTGRYSDVETLGNPGGPVPPLALEHPEPPATTKASRRPGRRTSKPPPVDSRQLELIARQPPKGDA